MYIHKLISTRSCVFSNAFGYLFVLCWLCKQISYLHIYINTSACVSETAQQDIPICMYVTVVKSKELVTCYWLGSDRTPARCSLLLRWQRVHSICYLNSHVTPITGIYIHIDTSKGICLHMSAATLLTAVEIANERKAKQKQRQRSFIRLSPPASYGMCRYICMYVAACAQLQHIFIAFIWCVFMHRIGSICLTF